MVKKCLLFMIVFVVASANLHPRQAESRLSTYKLSFITIKYINYNIETYDLVSKQTTEIYKNDNICLSPSWSSNGDRVVFSLLNNGHSKICLYSPKNKQIKSVFEKNRWIGMTKWSNQMNKIAFVSQVKGSLSDEIYIIDADGRNLSRLTENQFDDDSPSWSPEDKRIVFTSNRDKTWQLYVMDSNGLNQRRITHDNYNNKKPYWSPSGDEITFASDRSGKWEIYKMNLSNDRIVRLTHLNGESFYPAWSPDGKKIAFASSSSGSKVDYEIYIMNSDGKNLKQITKNNYEDTMPTWVKE